jgi:hypothetical protein
MYGLTRGTMTLIGAAGAGLLLWLATQFDADSSGEYWTRIGLLAAAGLAMALSQLLGGWTKWGWPRISGTVFLLGFLPALVVGGLVLLQAQPDSGAFGAGWAADVGADDLADDLTGVLPALAFGLGLLFGFTFDTTGRRRDVDVVEAEQVRRTGYAGPVPVDTRAADEPVAAERRATVTAPYRDGDRDGVDDRDEAIVGARNEHHDTDAHGHDDDDYGTPQTTEPEPRRKRFFGRG